MTKNKLVSALTACLLAAGGAGFIAITKEPRSRPDFIAAEGAGVSTLHWKSGNLYENYVNGGAVATLELTNAAEVDRGGIQYEFRILRSEHGFADMGIFNLSPVMQGFGSSQGGNLALCDMCGRLTARTPLASAYFVVSR